MPFVARTKGSMQMGLQTYARAVSLDPELRDHELEYLSARDWYMKQLADIAQVEEAIVQAKASGDKALATEMGLRKLGLQSKVQDARDRVKLIGNRSWAEAFMLLAFMMLSKAARSTLEEQTDKLLGRPRDELARTGGSQVDAMRRQGVTASDHAVLRYLERVKGVDIEAVRSEMLSPDVVSAIEGGATAVRRPGYQMPVEGGVIVTVLNEDHKLKRASRRAAVTLGAVAARVMGGGKQA